jgi:hypothetical protein
MSPFRCVITYLAQSKGGAVASLDRVSLEMRLVNAVIAYAAYLGKTFWPTDLAVMYLPPENWNTGCFVIAFAILIGITFFVLGPGRRKRHLAIGWFWFIGTLVPVIGLVQVGNQSMADRYTYLPLIGIFIMITWAAWETISRWGAARMVAGGVAGLTVLTCAGLTRQQVQHWQNSETLFSHCLRVTERNYIIHNHLGTSLLLEGRLDEAEEQYRESLRIKPDYSDALNNM